MGNKPQPELTSRSPQVTKAYVHQRALMRETIAT